MAIEAEKLTADNIYKVLIYFEKLYSAMSEEERRQIMEALIAEIQIYPERQLNGQWLKSIKFRLPVIENDLEMRLEQDSHIETWTVTDMFDGADKNDFSIGLYENTGFLYKGASTSPIEIIYWL